MKLNAFAASIALTAGLAFTGAAQSVELIIDDWDIVTGTELNAPPTGTLSRVTTTGGISLPRANLYLNATAATATIRDCITCQAGTFSNDTGVDAHGYWSWENVGDLDLSLFTKLELSYRADLPGADVIVSFWDGSTELGRVQLSDLPATTSTEPDPFYKNQVVDISALAPSLVGVDHIFLDVFSFGNGYNDANSKLGGTAGLGALELGRQVEDLDFRVRLNRLTYDVPEPATVALLGLALAGLGFGRRRRA